MRRVPKSPANPRRATVPRAKRSPPVGAESPAGEGARGKPPPEVSRLLGALGLERADADALHAQIARALESGARVTKRKGAAHAKARALATKGPADDVEPMRLVPLVLAVRDALKRGAPGARGTRARDERLDRACDVALRGLARSAEAASKPRVTSPSTSGSANARAENEAVREILQRIVALTPDAVITIRASGRLGLWSVAASRMTGRRRWEVQRRGLAGSFRDREEFAALLAEIEERGRISGREIVILNASGEEVPARLFGVRVKDPRPGGRKGDAPKAGRESDPERFLLLLHDLSEVQHIRRRLIETEKLSAMAKIAGSVAHEFRNPLNSLFLSTDLLEDELEGREEVRKSIAPTLAAIREEVERLNQIITHYLSLSKISSASPEKMDLAEVASGFAEENKERLEAEDVELRFRADEGGHRITADPNQVRRILVNLVENAVDAVRGEEAEGEERPRRGRVTIYVRRMRRSVKVTVKDNGPGIPEDVRERVYEPFFTSKAGGSGLGLYLVREIALASGGALTLSSAPGRGTSVSIRWPHAQEGENGKP